MAAVARSRVVELKRGVARARARGPEAGLAHVDAIRSDPALAAYHWLPSVRGDLLARLGRAGEACEEFLKAAALAQNERERAFLQERARQLSS